jgi:hypothetical protein
LVKRCQSDSSTEHCSLIDALSNEPDLKSWAFKNNAIIAWPCFIEQGLKFIRALLKPDILRIHHNPCW